MKSCLETSPTPNTIDLEMYLHKCIYGNSFCDMALEFTCSNNRGRDNKVFHVPGPFWFNSNLTSVINECNDKDEIVQVLKNMIISPSDCLIYF